MRDEREAGREFIFKQASKILERVEIDPAGVEYGRPEVHGETGGELLAVADFLHHLVVFFRFLLLVNIQKLAQMFARHPQRHFVRLLLIHHLFELIHIGARLGPGR